MTREITTYSRRYVVQVGEQAWSGAHPTRVEWRFDRAFNADDDAAAYAGRVSEDYEFVRVIDREASNG